MKTFSAIIITRDRPQQLNRAVASLKTLPLREVVVMDNNSKNKPTFQESNIVTIHNEAMKGVAFNRSHGVIETQSDYIIFLDDDAYIEQLDLEKISSYFETHPDVGIIGPRVLYPNRNVQESVRTFPTPRVLLWRGFGIYKLFKPRWYLHYVEPVKSTVTEPQQVDWVIGACMMVRKAMLNKIGMFDEKYFFGYEDADLCKRALQNGFRTVYWPDASVVHEYTRSSANLFSKAALRHGLSIFRFFLKTL